MLRPVIALLLLLLMPWARAQTPIALFESFAGNVNFAGTQKSIRTQSNAGDPCAVTTNAVSASVSGIPAGATILRAHLYWAGSGSTADYAVRLGNTNLTAPASRQYSVVANGRSYFSGAVDVTSLVSGNGSYTFRNLDIQNTGTFCTVEGVVGGYALLVIYQHANEPFRVLNLYEGFQPTHYSSVDLTLSNFKIPNPIGTATGRIGHITWEGDATLGNTNEENLLFNGIEQFDPGTPSVNPRYNQFNSTSNINGDTASYGIDFDAYTITSPTIQGGQTAATTRYQSGQDLVLLSAEVVAVPNVPVSDLSIAMAVGNTSMTQGTANSYQITVTNLGPNIEPGSIVVTDTIHSDLTINSVVATGWSCVVSGQLVTCTRAGTLATGVSTSTITINVTPNVNPGEIVNSASVSGQNFDNNDPNSTATVTTFGAAADYVFTDRACVDNIAIGNVNQPCKLFVFGTRIAGDDVTSIWVTSLGAGGVPRKLHNTQDRTVNFYFGLACVNPSTSAGVVPTFTARAAMSTCSGVVPKPVGSIDSAVVFAGGTPSSRVGYTFRYNDVGMVELYFVDSNARTGSSGSFVVKPASIVLSNIQQSAALVNPAPATATGTKFVRAGEAFSMTISALNSGGTATPNFGRESPAETFNISYSVPADPDLVAAMGQVPNISGSFGAIVAGVASGNGFSWPEVGVLRLTPGITSANYLGKGDVTGTPVNVGRFYPDHFDTTVTPPMSACASNMGCVPGLGAAYSGQPFKVTVIARNAANAQLKNFRLQLARPVRLSAWNGTASGSIQNPPAAPVLPASFDAPPALVNTDIASTSFADGIAQTAVPAYNLPNKFTANAPRANNWVAPTTIFLRADGQGGDGVTSRLASGTEEGSIRIVSGRLQVANAYGSDVLALPVKVNAQYWTGTRWENSIKDGISVADGGSLTDEPSKVLPTTANLVFTNCLANLCTVTLSSASTAEFALAKGAGTIRLQAPGAGKSGSVLMESKSPGWLPSTKAKLSFGFRKVPLDYIREVY